MDIIEELQKELKSEYGITKKFLDRYPEAGSTWKPHEKSMDMNALTVHIVDILGWADLILNTDYLDFAATPFTPPSLKTRGELQRKLDKAYQKGAAALARLTPAALDGKWDIRQGATVFQEWSKYGAIRHSLQQITHHRAQLGVYYRLNDIPVPASYGPSADEH